MSNDKYSLQIGKNKQEQGMWEKVGFTGVSNAHDFLLSSAKGMTNE